MYRITHLYWRVSQYVYNNSPILQGISMRWMVKCLNITLKTIEEKKVNIVQKIHTGITFTLVVIGHIIKINHMSSIKTELTTQNFKILLIFYIWLGSDCLFVLWSSHLTTTTEDGICIKDKVVIFLISYLLQFPFFITNSIGSQTLTAFWLLSSELHS